MISVFSEDDDGNTGGAINHPGNKLREILRSYGLAIAVAVLIIYIALQALYINTFLSHVIVVNIPQTTYPPDVIQMLDQMADQADQQMNETSGPGNFTPADRSWQYPQGPTQGTMTQIVPGLMAMTAISLTIATLLQWAIFSIAAFILLKLPGKSPGWGVVSAVGCAFAVLIPFVIITIGLVSLMPVYTIDHSMIVSGSATGIINNIANDAQFQMVRPIMLVGWICFGILLIFNIKMIGEVDLRHAMIAGGIPVLLYLLYEYNKEIIGFIHHFI